MRPVLRRRRRAALRPAAHVRGDHAHYLPAHRPLVYASGAAEALGGTGLLHPATRRLAGWWLVATLLAIFPANVWMAQHPERYRIPGGRATLLARLPLQAVLVAWVRAAAQRSSPRSARS